MKKLSKEELKQVMETAWKALIAQDFKERMAKCNKANKEFKPVREKLLDGRLKKDIDKWIVMGKPHSKT